MGFDDLIIPLQVKHALRRSVRDRRLPPAYLFVGPEGVGKQTTALVLAKALNCPVGDGDACERCSTCLRIEHRVHPDIHLLEPQGQAIKIDQIRQLQDVLMLQAYEGQVKVAIVDDAGQLTVEAANSLLKVLEEPPSRTLFVLVSRQLANLPATLLSRAQILRFGLVAPDQITAWLCRQARDASEAQRIAYLCGGRPGAALTLDAAAIGERRAEAIALLNEALSGDPALALVNAEQWGKRKGDQAMLFTVLLAVLRDLAIAQVGGVAGYLLHGDLRDTLLPLAPELTLPTIWEIFDVVHSAQEAVARNVNPQLAFEVMFFKIGEVYERARQRDRARQRYLHV